MNSHYQLTDQEFTTAFMELTLDSKLFTHEAHLRLVWIYISQYGLKTAEVVLCEQIKSYVESLGEGDKFNITVTVAATKAVHHFIGRSNSETFEDLIQEFPRLKTEFKGLMGFHYGFEIFNNTTAKKVYLAPDLIPF